jgi:hypothetical protein
MPLVDEAIQRRASPAQLNVKVRPDGRRDSAEGSNCHLVDSAKLGARHALLTHAARLSNVGLTPSQFEADRP